MSTEETIRGSSDPYYDLIDDFDLIISSFQSQYGLRLSRELKEMKWGEFSGLLSGISPDTALGRIVAIRSESNKDILKHFTKEQRRIRNKWKLKRAKAIQPQDMDGILESLKQGFIAMAGGDASVSR